MKDGFSIAAMFTAYDDNPEPILDDPTYGELLIRYTRWGENPDGTFYDEYVNLDTHYCTPEELGLKEGDDKEKTGFYPIRPDSKP